MKNGFMILILISLIFLAGCSFSEKQHITPIISEPNFPSPTQGCAYNNPPCGEIYYCEKNACVLKQGCQYNNPPCNPDYKCVDNRCTSSFYDNAEKDVIEIDLPKTDSPENDAPSLSPQEKALSLYGKFLVIFPDESSFKEIAENNLISNYFCYLKIQDVLGIEPDPLIDTNFIYEKIRISDISQSSATQNAIVSAAPMAYWQNYKTNNLPLTKEYISNDFCPNDHEMTHLFVANTPIYHWLNEGLATYMEYKIGYKKQLNLSEICQPNKILYPYYGTAYSYPENAPTNRMNLAVYEAQYPLSLYYYTGACFWYEVENIYGPQKLKEIMKALASRRTQRPENLQNEYCTQFIKIFEQGLGEQIPEELLGKYGLNRDMIVSSESCQNI